MRSFLFNTTKKKMEISWYVKLNIMVLVFFFVLVLIKRLNTPVFQAGLNNIFSPASPPKERSVRIQIHSEKTKKEKSDRQ